MLKILKPVLLTLAIILPALFTWLETRARADEEKIKAAITYGILQDSVKELQAASYTQALQLARIEGKLDRPASGQLKTTVKPFGSGKLHEDFDSIADIPTFKEIPDYKDAVRAKK
jgi:hypothetical protein